MLGVRGFLQPLLSLFHAWCSLTPIFLQHLAAPRSCIIDKDELKDGLRVLIPMDDKLLYAGHVKTVHSPDM